MGAKARLCGSSGGSGRHGDELLTALGFDSALYPAQGGEQGWSSCGGTGSDGNTG